MAAVSEELAPAVDGMLDALERTDLDAAWAAIAPICAEGIHFTSMVGDAVEGRRYEGPEGIREWFEDLTGSFDVAYRDRQYKEGRSGKLVILAMLTLRGRRSDAELVQDVAIVLEPDGEGRVLRAKTFGSHAAALEEAEATGA